MSGRPPPTVSIVTPSYNQGAFLAETIESVLSQEGDFHVDYVIVDGASTDNSVEIIRRYESLIIAQKWPIRCRGIRYRWVSEEDLGQTDAIVKGFRMAEGGILSWLNSDDTLLPGALEKVEGYLGSHAAVALVHGRVHFTDESGRIVSEVETGPTDHEGLASLNLVCQPAAFFRRTALEAAGGLDRELRYAMDHDLWIRMARQHALGYIAEFLATYRLHPESKTRASAHAVKFQEETLEILMRHYGRAPLNRVYGYCSERVKSRLPGGWPRSELMVAVPSLLFTVAKYLQLNRGIRLEDIRMIRPGNLRKLFRRPVGRPLEPGP
jgi:glycosyltransferase involved in cell wall biosynthesis